MAAITINGRPAEARDGEMLLGVLRREGVRVPTLCQIDGLDANGACRLCVVEIDGRPGLVPSCSAPVEDGMVVQTHSPRAVAARRTLVELLLNNHPDDCLYCPRHGACQLQDLAEELGVRTRRFHGSHERMTRDVSSPSIVRDPEKCVLCGKCVRVCEEIQGVSAIDFTGRGCHARIDTAFGEGLNVSSCINCGQCVMVCPTGALSEHSHLDAVEAAITDPETTVVAQCAPSISVSLAELCGEEPGRDVDGAMVGLLRRLGFAHVFDTSYSADLTIMEEASELVHRLQNGGTLPMMTSCSPGWVKFVETFYPEFGGNLSTCKSPQQMLGALIKELWAPKAGLDPKKVFSVSIMPCTAKKFEAARPEMMGGGVADVDAVLTTRELAKLVRRRGLRLADCAPEVADMPFGTRSGAGKIFGATGGVMEAAARTAHWLVTGEDASDLDVTAVRGFEGVKEAKVKAGDVELGVAVASGLGNARALLDQIKAGRDDLHFIEIMTCPGGCLAGGGQPFDSDPETLKARMGALYRIDGDETIRTAHGNPAVKELYDEFLGEPLSHRSHELLHTRYAERDVLV